MEDDGTYRPLIPGAKPVGSRDKADTPDAWEKRFEALERRLKELLNKPEEPPEPPREPINPNATIVGRGAPPPPPEPPAELDDGILAALKSAESSVSGLMEEVERKRDARFGVDPNKFESSFQPPKEMDHHKHDEDEAADSTTTTSMHQPWWEPTFNLDPDTGTFTVDIGVGLCKSAEGNASSPPSELLPNRQLLSTTVAATTGNVLTDNATTYFFAQADFVGRDDVVAVINSDEVTLTGSGQYPAVDIELRAYLWEDATFSLVSNITGVQPSDSATGTTWRCYQYLGEVPLVSGALQTYYWETGNALYWPLPIITGRDGNISAAIPPTNQ